MEAKTFRANGDYVREHMAAQAPHFDLAGQLPAESERPANTEKGTAELVDELLASFTERLRIAFDQPDQEALYSYAVNLPEHNPARRTLELIFQANRGLIGKEEVTHAVAYIEKCTEADPELRNGLGFGHYTVDFLDQLRSTAWHLTYILRKDEAEG